MRAILAYFLIFTIFMSGMFSIDEEIHAQSMPETIQIWHPFQGERAEFFDNFIAEYNAMAENDRIVESVAFQNAGTLYDQIILQLINNQALPAMAIVWPYEAAIFDLADVVHDLSPYVDFLAVEQPLWIDPLTYAQDPVTEKVLGLPLRLFTHQLYVNQDALRELGYDEPPTTLAEIGEMACAFQAAAGWSRGEFGVVHGLDVVLDAETLFALALAQGETLFDGESFVFTSDALKTLLVSLLDLQAESCLRFLPNRATGIDTFARGQSLFFIDSSSSSQVIEQAIALNFAQPFVWDTVPLANEGSQLVYGSIVTLFRQADHLSDDTLAFLAWLMQAEQRQAWATFTHGLSLESPVAEFSTMPLPALAGYDVIRLEIQFALERIVADAETIEPELSALTALSNTIWRSYYGLEEISE